MSALIERLQQSEWNQFAAVAAFVLTFGVFLFGSWRALRMKKKKRDHLSSLPLEDEEHHAEKDKTNDKPQ